MEGGAQPCVAGLRGPEGWQGKEVGQGGSALCQRGPAARSNLPGGAQPRGRGRPPEEGAGPHRRARERLSKGPGQRASGYMCAPTTPFRFSCALGGRTDVGEGAWRAGSKGAPMYMLLVRPWLRLLIKSYNRFFIVRDALTTLRGAVPCGGV